MNFGPLLFLGVFFTVTLSWFSLVLGPHLQFGDEEMVTLEETGQDYPWSRTGEALAGREVYRANGCVYCHTQQVRSAADGADIARGWGTRRTVARDYLRDQPVFLGTLRLGPDLTNLGLRETNSMTLLLKLYNPRLSLPNSSMPRYPFLFETHQLRPGEPASPDALPLTGTFAPPAGCEVVPRPEARELVAYLRSLQAAPLFYEVFPPPRPKRGTNQVARATGTNAVPTATSNTNAGAAAATNAPVTR